MQNKIQVTKVFLSRAILCFFQFFTLLASAGWVQAQSLATTPIEHLIVIVGENRTFDNLFGVYQPLKGQTISNLLSKKIVNPDGTPGPNFALAAQKIATNFGVYTPTPAVIGSYTHLPQPYANGAPGQKHEVPDQRFPQQMPNGPYQITHHVSYGAHTGDPTHRFFQMWQQINGGKQNLFVWTAEMTGPGPSDDPPPLGAGHTLQGGVAMGFYNMASGDAPYFKYLADTYAIADNYHQSVMGGTTVNYFALATADVAIYNEQGKAAVPPQKRIENPDAQPNTNNWYIEDGYGGGSYVKCAEPAQAGVAGIRNFLKNLPYPAFNDGNCSLDNYYLVNNLDPGYSPTGTALELGADKYVLPPQTMPHIGDALSAAGVSWKWYSGGRKDGHNALKEYCATCDTLTSFTSTMTGQDKEKLQDLDRFFVDVKDATTFPAVAVISPSDSISGHPGYSAEPYFDTLVKSVVESVQGNPALWKNTAILVTFDEGGGNYDSGYIQFIDFFGDGTRVPLIAISTFAKPGHVDHTYYDHASILKFIERNWSLSPLSKRSRDNLPNPVEDKANPYVPLNRPAVGDLMQLFNFNK
jgi:phospholipase C